MDNINPRHYRKGEVECIDAISSAVVGLEGVEAMLVGNAMKYLWRWKDKNGVEDLRKAQWYLNRLICEVERTAPKSKPSPCQLHDTDWYPPHENRHINEIIFAQPGLTD